MCLLSSDENLILITLSWLPGCVRGIWVRGIMYFFFYFRNKTYIIISWSRCVYIISYANVMQAIQINIGHDKHFFYWADIKHKGSQHVVQPDKCPSSSSEGSMVTTQLAHNIKMTSYQRRHFNVVCPLGTWWSKSLRTLSDREYG